MLHPSAAKPPQTSEGHLAAKKSATSANTTGCLAAKRVMVRFGRPETNHLPPRSAPDG
jgi:hypothetical protein